MISIICGGLGDAEEDTIRICSDRGDRGDRASDRATPRRDCVGGVKEDALIKTATAAPPSSWARNIRYLPSSARDSSDRTSSDRNSSDRNSPSGSYLSHTKMTTTIPSPGRNILLTHPRSASHLLLRMLNLPAQPRLHSADYYFFPLYSAVFDQRSLYLRPCLLYTSPSPRDGLLSRMPSSA